jgi:hypothetical protein
MVSNLHKNLTPYPLPYKGRGKLSLSHCGGEVWRGVFLISGDVYLWN